MGASPYEVVVHPSGSSIWVANQVGDSVSVIDRLDWSVTTIPAGNGPRAICFNRSGTYAYVVNDSGNNVSVIKVATKAFTATIPVESGPVGISMDRSDRYLYVANFGGNNVSVADVTTNTIAATVPVGTGPQPLGRFINASSLWTAAVSTPFKTTYLNEDAKGNVKFKTTNESVDGDCYLYATYRTPVRLNCSFTNGTYFYLDKVTHLSTENPKAKTEQVIMNGTGRGEVHLRDNRLFPGFASFEGKGTLKKESGGGEVTTILLTGKVTIHADTGVVGTANLRLTFTRLP